MAPVSLPSVFCEDAAAGAEVSPASDYLAVDMGASSVRVMRGRFDGERFELSEISRFENGPVAVMGDQHWNVLELWRQLEGALTRFAADGGRAAGIGVDTWGVDFALLDEHGRLLGNPFHYRDHRTDGAPERLADRLPPGELYACTGIQVMQINTLFQLWVMAEQGDVRLAAADRLLMMPDLFAYWLSGVQAGEYTIASTSHMLDARRRDWAKELLGELSLPVGLLPQLISPGTVLGPLREPLAGRLGEVPVIAVGGHDTASAVAAVPELDERSAFLSSGTWSLLGAEVDEPVLSERAMQLNFTNEGGVGGKIRLLKNVAGLWLLQECRRCWRQQGLELGWREILEQARAAKAFRSIVDPDASEFLSPDDMVSAIADFCRRSGQPQPKSVGEIARCCLESLALRYRWVLEALESLTGRPVGTIRVVGGGSRNELLNQFTADACRRAVVAGPVEATALGNVMVQAIATGRLGDISAGRAAVAASVERSRFEPSDTEGWDEAFERFQGLLVS